MTIAAHGPHRARCGDLCVPPSSLSVNAPARHLGAMRLPPAWLVVLSGIVIAMHVGKMPPAIPVLQQALGVSLVQAGFLLSAVQLAGMALGVLAGMSADRLGLRRSLLTGQIILALASLAGMAVTSPSGLLALRALEGLGLWLARRVRFQRRLSVRWVREANRPLALTQQARAAINFEK